MNFAQGSWEHKVHNTCRAYPNLGGFWYGQGNELGCKETVTTSEIVISESLARIRKKMAPRAAFWVDRHISLKFTVFVWEFDGK